MSAPQRIWAFPPTTFDEMDVWQAEPHEDAIEYVRADLMDGLLAAMQELLQVNDGLPMLGIEASRRIEAARAAIRAATPDQIAKLAKGEP